MDRIGKSPISTPVLVVIALIQLGQPAAVGIPERNTGFQTHGLYRLTRNPVYVGAFTICLASCFYSIHLLNILLFAIVVGVHARIVAKEEPFLEKRFRQQWLDHTQRVPRYLGIMKQPDAGDMCRHRRYDCRWKETNNQPRRCYQRPNSFATHQLMRRSSSWQATRQIC